ncbi:hypothetical protein P3T21_001392 [Paraburkholderia sp. GAS334]
MKMARSADQSGTAATVRFVPVSAARTFKSVSPSQPLDVLETVVFGGKPFLKLGPRSRIVLASSRHVQGFFHPAIMAELVLTG